MQLCKLLGGVLAKVVRSQFKGELEILDRNTFTRATESVVNMLCKRGSEHDAGVPGYPGAGWAHVAGGCSVWVRDWVSAAGEGWGLVPGLVWEDGAGE